MVHRRSSQPVLVGCLILGLFLSGLPAPVMANHPFFTVPAPTDGMTVDVAGELRLDFTGTDSRLTAHHEWRDLAVVQMAIRYDGGLHPYTDLLYDLETGSLLGHGWTSNHTYSGSATLPFLVTEREWSSASFDNDPIHHLLPESLLWGRTFWPGETWDVPLRSTGCDDAATQVRTAGDRDGGGFTNVTAQITVDCSWTHSVWQSTWTLRFEDAAMSPVAHERVFSYHYEYDDGETFYNESGERTVDTTVTDNGGEGLPFQGRSDVSFWAERDQMLDYSVWADLFPVDPQPHATFDIRDAGAQALDPTDERVRVFLSRAEQVHLMSARMLEGPEVSWSFTFMDDKGSALQVSLRGVKLPDQPLIVRDHEATLRTAWSTWAPAPGQEVAQPGDLARLTDQMLAAAGLEPTGYEWSRSGYPTRFTYATSYQIPDADPLHHASGRVASDATTGWVTDHSEDESRTTVRLDPLI